MKQMMRVAAMGIVGMMVLVALSAAADPYIETDGSQYICISGDPVAINNIGYCNRRPGNAIMRDRKDRLYGQRPEKGDTRAEA